MSCIFLVIVSVIVLVITFVFVLIVNAFIHQYLHISFIHLLLFIALLTINTTWPFKAGIIPVHQYSSRIKLC
jgi:hypothetical protein